MSLRRPYRREKTRPAKDPRKILIEAGLYLFGRYSFEGTSTRMLAERTKVNLAAIQYYFGGKTGLYLAVANHIVKQVNSYLGPKLSEVRSVLEQGTTPKEQCLHLLCDLVEVLATRLVGTSKSDKWLGIIVREQSRPTEAFDILFDGFLKPFYEILFELVARIQGSDPNEPEVKVMAFTVIGQVFIFRMSMTSVKHTLNLKDYNQKDTGMIRRVILDNIRTIFSSTPASFSPAVISHDKQ